MSSRIPLLLLVALGLAFVAPPTDVDLRPKLEGWKLVPRSQGPRGTCSVFAVTQAIEFALAADGEPTRLSPEFLNWASNDAVGQGADGGFFSDLWKGFEKHGICGESDLPYRDHFDPALVPSAEARTHATAIRDRGFVMHWIKPWDVTTGLTDEHLAAMQTTLERGMPLCVGLRWPKRERWEGPVLQWAEPGDVFDGHSVLFVGVRRDAKDPKEGVFLVRNTNPAHAEFEMPFAYARAYANDVMWIEATREQHAK